VITVYLFHLQLNRPSAFILQSSTVFFLNQDQEYALKYDSGSNKVIVQKYDDNDPTFSFKFELPN